MSRGLSVFGRASHAARRAAVLVLASCAFLAPTARPLGASTRAVAEAERLATEASRLAAERPVEAETLARRALAATEAFDPTDFVEAGRKGEVVEDAYVAARRAYREHRARVYAALGRALLAQAETAAAVRYLRRGVELDAVSGPRTELAQGLVTLGRGWQALSVLLAPQPIRLGPEAAGVAGQAADALALPSLQAEIDRVRLGRLSVRPPLEPRDGPIRLPAAAQLSTGAPLRLDVAEPTLVYVAEIGCRTCSADLERLKRLPGEGLRVLVAPEEAERDTALRQVLKVYRYDWPVVTRIKAAQELGVVAPAAVLVARGGFLAIVMKPPFDEVLPAALEVIGAADVREPLPRAAWNRRPVTRQAPPPQPELLAEGLAPGEDEPAPAAFTDAVEAYRAGRYGPALEAFDALAARGDGWLLPPEARLNRALCLAGLGRRDEARRLLLRTGDSRFQDAVDRALERVGSR